MTAALRAAAEREHRSIAKLVEVMILDNVGRDRVTIPEQRVLFDERRGGEPTKDAETNLRGK